MYGWIVYLPYEFLARCFRRAKHPNERMRAKPYQTKVPHELMN